MNAWEKAVANSPARRAARERKARKAAAEAAQASARTALPSVGEVIRKSLLGIAPESSADHGVDALQLVQGRKGNNPSSEETSGEDSGLQISGRTLKRTGEAKVVRARANKEGDHASPARPAPPRPAPLPFDYRAEVRAILREPEDDGRVVIKDAEAPHIISCGGCGWETGQHFAWDDAVAEYTGHRCDV
jgi:hypothetical protein